MSTHAIRHRVHESRRQQQSDEQPMVWGTLVWIYVLWSPKWQHNK